MIITLMHDGDVDGRVSTTIGTDATRISQADYEGRDFEASMSFQCSISYELYSAITN